MIGIFASSAASGGGLLNNSLLDFILVLAVGFIFLKYCGWASRFSLAAGVKKLIYILTGAALVAFNVFYSLGNAMISEQGSFDGATGALVGALLWVAIFTFALVARTKPPDEQRA
jgi:hypothetical protein